MKLIHIEYLTISLFILLFSCKKEEISPQTNTIVIIDSIIVERNTKIIIDTIIITRKDSLVFTSVTNPPFIYNNLTNKLWAHQINTIEEANNALQNFTGVEIDMYYHQDLDYFDIGKNGIKTNLSLENYFASMKNPHYYYWLDFKNLTADNMYEAYARLNLLMTKFNLKNNIIIESPNAESLGYFADNGLFTSYWIPWVNNPTSTNNNGIAAEISYYLKKYPFSVISSDYRLYPFIQTYFPYQNVHLWVKNTDVENEEQAKQIIRNLVQHSQIKVILVDLDDNFILSE